MNIQINQKPLKVSCFSCQKEFEIKWVISQRDYSKKNSWEYWVEEEKSAKKKICNECLKKIYQENGKIYKSLSSKKKNLFRVYLSSGKFD